MKPLIDRLLEAQVAGCTCMTKTPDFEHHRDDCHYRLFHEARFVIFAYELLLKRIFRWHVQVEGGGMMPGPLADELRDAVGPKP